MVQNKYLKDDSIDLHFNNASEKNVPINASIDTKQIKALNIFWAGFILYTVSATLSIALVAKYHANYSILQYLQIVAIVLFSVSAVYIIKFKFESTYLKLVYTLYILWLAIVIIRGFNLNVDFLKDTFFDGSFGIFPYFVPLLLLFPQNLLSYKKVFDIIFIISLFYIFFDFVFINDLLNRDVYNSASQTIADYFSKNLALPCGFLFLSYKYQSKSRRLISLAIIIISVFFVIIRARRALIFILSAPLIIAYLFYLLQSKAKFLIIAFSVMGSLFLSIYGIKAYNESNVFNSVKERGTINSRSPVEDCFYDDMKFNDWVVGRGMNGNYYCADIDESLKTNYRLVIETDYLNIILKGGIISLGLLLLIAIPAIIKGIFYSKNFLSKAAGFWILLWLISLYPSTVTTFTMGYLMVWISIGICYNKRIRNMPESIMKLYFLTQL